MNIKDIANRFIKLIKSEAPKEDIEPYFFYLNNIPQINEQGIKILRMRLLEKKTFKQIGEVFGFTRERARQQFYKGMHYVEEASK